MLVGNTSHGCTSKWQERFCHIIHHWRPSKIIKRTAVTNVMPSCVWLCDKTLSLVSLVECQQWLYYTWYHLNKDPRSLSGMRNNNLYLFRCSNCRDFSHFPHCLVMVNDTLGALMVCVDSVCINVETQHCLCDTTQTNGWSSILKQNAQMSFGNIRTIVLLLMLRYETFSPTLCNVN